MADVPLDFVPYPEQVQRLMKSALEEARRFRRHTLVLPPSFWAYAVPGAIFVWNSERNGYINKLMRIDGVVDRANLDVMIDITEVDPADYDWDSATDFQPPVDGAVGPIRVAPQPIVDWFAVGDVVKDNSGVSRRPAIRLSWDGSEERIIDVIGVEFEVRNATSLETVYSGRTDQPGVGSLLISQGLVANVTYGVRGRYIPRSERETLWSNWLNVTTPNILITDVFVEELAQVGQGIVDRFKELQQEMDDYLRPTVQQILDAFSLEGAVGQVQRQELRAELGSALAQIIEERRVRVSETEALAQSIRILSASIANATARVISEETARVNADNALASSITGVSADVNGRFAEGLVKFEAVSAPTGVDARFSVMLRAGTNESFKVSGFFVEIYTEGGVQKSRMAVQADLFAVTSGNNRHYPLVYENGVLKLAVADIGLVNSGRLLALNGKMDINLNNGTIEIFS